MRTHCFANVTMSETIMRESKTEASKGTQISDGNKLSLSERTYLSLNEAYRYTWNTLSAALGLSRLSKVTISAGEPVCLLAKMYPDVPSDGIDAHDEEETMAAAMSQFEMDLSERLWFSYRTGFPPIGEDHLTGDVGWGCTLRSCQMLLAQALLMHLLGRWAPAADSKHTTAMKQRVVSRFYDDPGSCFSIHSICAAGAKYGLVPGRWMGPYALCRAVADISQQRCPDGMHVSVIESGGGAPCIDPDRLKQYLQPPACDAAAPGGAQHGAQRRGLLVLVPVVLGVERLNSAYTQQLRLLLQWPQSVGIIGGRPGHSYYFMGFQGDRLICLDPHVMQPTDAAAGHLATHRPVGVQSVPMAAIDSTMALGFYCGSAAEVEHLAAQVRELAARFSRSPLLSIGSLPDLQDHDFDCDWDSGEDHTDGEENRDGDISVASVSEGKSASKCEEEAQGQEGVVAVREGCQEAAAAESTNGCSEGPSSPVVVCGTLSSVELASTGDCGWEIVHSDATEQAFGNDKDMA
eukprot:jgi/Ulvmu1/623/UM001_0631.1